MGELALTWDLMSYGLKMPRLAALVWFRKAGLAVCYQLGHDFRHPRLGHCLPQPLIIASPETGRGHR